MSSMEVSTRRRRLSCFSRQFRQSRELIGAIRELAATAPLRFQLAVLESRGMFEVKVQTYWADADSVGIIFFPHFFRFVEQAEEELFRAAGADRHGLLEANRVWMPRVEAFSKFLKPIKCGAAIRIRLNPQLK